MAALLDRLADQVGKTATLHRAIAAASAYYRQPYPRMMADALRLYLSEQFSFREIIAYGLVVPEQRAAPPVLISKQRSLAKLRRLNPYRQQADTENKLDFYRICQRHDLPIPTLYAAIGPERGETADGRWLGDEAAWVDYLDRVLPARFIAKDIGGAYGSGLAAFERQGRRIREVGGDEHDVAGLYRRLRSGRSTLVVQERLFDHPDLAALRGRSGLQSVRINTLLRPDGEVELLFWFLKIVTGDNLSDNFVGGTTGNLVAVGDRERGIVDHAVTLSPCGLGLTPIDRHPETGASLNGFAMPGWTAALDVVRRAHREAFPAFGALGWDVALTADGPKLLETNAWWDPPNYAPEIMSPAHWQRIFG